VKPNALVGLSVAVVPEYRSRRVSQAVVLAIKSLALRYRLSGPVIPVRPILKSLYPTIPMSRYVYWQDDNGDPFDPWIRVHWRLGARIARVAPRSMVITGSVSEWEQWTEMKFPESGSYVIPGALCPVTIDLEEDSGIYVEPNVWMSYDSAPFTSGQMAMSF
jgi:hypothetical protein